MTQIASWFLASAMFFQECDHSNVFKCMLMIDNYSTEKLMEGDGHRQRNLE